MNISFRSITRENYEECLTLSVANDQQDFVAPNWYSLVQAAYEPDMYPMGIYLDEKMVGFILYDLEKNGWSMSRFMIDQSYQNRGIGKIALNKFLKIFTENYGNVPLYTSTAITNNIVIALYESFGFKKLEEFSYEHHGKIYHEVKMILRNV